MHRLQALVNHLTASSDERNHSQDLQPQYAAHAENHITPSTEVKVIIFDPTTDITTKQYENGCFEITLQRPKALNSLSLDGRVRAVVVRAASKSFCAGGDLKEFIAKDGRWKFAAPEKIHRLPKPYITLVDGVAMGGGVGISVHGKYRVVSEKILWAMPEAIVGFLTDVGGTHFLARCPGKTGLYLALTGNKIRVEDAMYCGIGTHFVPSVSIEALRHALSSEDISSSERVEDVLERFSKDVEGKSMLKELSEKIDYCFGADSVEEIIHRLQADDSEWAQETLKPLQHNCPMSLKVIMEAIKRAQNVSFEEAIAAELRIGVRLVERNDIQEGVRALLIDRDNCPIWQPAKLEEITQDDVDAFFLPFEDSSKELQFY